MLHDYMFDYMFDSRHEIHVPIGHDIYIETIHYSRSYNMTPTQIPRTKNKRNPSNLPYSCIV